MTLAEVLIVGTLAHFVGDYLIQSGGSPQITVDDSPDKSLRNAELGSECTLGDTTVEVALADLADLSISQDRTAMLFSSRHPLRNSVGPVVVAPRNNLRSNSGPVPSPGNNILHVLSGRARRQVSWVAAWRVVAGMEQHRPPCGNLSHFQLIRQPVRSPRLANAASVTVEQTVATRHRGPGPRPTSIRSTAAVDLLPEPLDVHLGQKKFVHVVDGSRSTVRPICATRGGLR